MRGFDSLSLCKRPCASAANHLQTIAIARESLAKVTTDKITGCNCLQQLKKAANATRHATLYPAPLYLAQARGYFKDVGLRVALLEPNNPSDVTEIIGSGKLDMGLKDMIRTLPVCGPEVCAGSVCPRGA